MRILNGVPDQMPPGPALPGLVQALLLAPGPPFLRWCQRRYGDRFTLRLGRFGTYVYLADPADIREVFHGDDTVLHAGEANAPFLGRILGPSSVLVTDGAEHMRQRRRLTGSFHGEAIARLVPQMAAIAAADIEHWPAGRPFAVLPRMRAVTLEVILRTVIGLTDGPRLDSMRAALLELTDIGLLDMAQFVFPGLGRLGPWRRFWVAKDRADALLRHEIESCRADPALGERRDVLALLVRSAGTGVASGAEEPMGVEELRDQIVTLLLAGHETTATGLAWTLERLTRHPAVLRRATDAARSGDSEYLDAVVTESLRSRPVVPDISRRLAAEYRLGGHVIPAGTYVDPAIALVHASERLWPRPETFDPSRFVGARPDPTIWLPFGGGNRRCIGAAFAATEMRVVLAEVLTRVDLEPTSARPEKARVRHVTLAPHRGAVVRVRRRRPAGPSAGSPPVAA